MRECRYNGNCCVMYHRPFDSDDLPCDGFDEDICSLYKPMPDMRALKGLADEMDRVADENRLTGMMSIGRARAWADRIRESLGETS